MLTHDHDDNSLLGIFYIFLLLAISTFHTFSTADVNFVNECLCTGQLLLLRCSRFPDSNFPGWSFSWMVFPGREVSRKDDYRMLKYDDS